MSLAITKLILGSVLLIFSVLIAFNTYNEQKKITTQTKAAVAWNTCQSDPPTNFPCGSCAFGTNIQIDKETATVSFGCELVCDATYSQTPPDYSNCPDPADKIFSINATAWFWCRKSSTDACTESSTDLIAQGQINGGPWTINQQIRMPYQGDGSWSGTFTIPAFTNCGRIQTDAALNAEGVAMTGAKYPLGQDCAVPTNTPAPTATETPIPSETTTPAPTELPTGSPTPSTSPIPSDTPVPTDTITPSATASPVPTHTPTPIPTDTPVPTETTAPIATSIPNTPIPSDTVVPPVPTSTIVVTLTNTPAPTNTLALAPSNTPTSSPVVTHKLEVKGQPPGSPIPWLMIGIPLSLMLLGLLL